MQKNNQKPEILNNTNNSLESDINYNFYGPKTVKENIRSKENYSFSGTSISSNKKTAPERSGAAAVRGEGPCREKRRPATAGSISISGSGSPLRTGNRSRSTAKRPRNGTRRSPRSSRPGPPRPSAGRRSSWPNTVPTGSGGLRRRCPRSAR